MGKPISKGVKAFVVSVIIIILGIILIAEGFKTQTIPYYGIAIWTIGTAIWIKSMYMMDREFY